MKKKKLFVKFINIVLLVQLMIALDSVAIFGAINILNVVTFVEGNGQLSSSQIELASHSMAIGILFLMVMIIWAGFKMIDEFGEWFERKLGVGKYEETDLHKVQA